mmetsp:Transcript_54784/g.79921  ORF Transcript_54784/g.79921 Transcript_54784/m.79921 type:complete len:85 (-) Transcript_54784:241-495(-)
MLTFSNHGKPLYFPECIIACVPQSITNINIFDSPGMAPSFLMQDLQSKGFKSLKDLTWAASFIYSIPPAGTGGYKDDHHQEGLR